MFILQSELRRQAALGITQARLVLLSLALSLHPKSVSQTKNFKIMDALFCLYIIIVVAVFVRDEFKDEDDKVGDHCIKNCE